MVPRVGAVATPTQRLSHALGDPAAPSRHIPAVSAVPDPLPLQGRERVKDPQVVLQISLFRVIRVKMLWRFTRNTLKF